MRVIPVTLSVPDVKSELARLIIREQKCLVFVDTNILLWVFRLNALARKELLSWLEELSDCDRLFFPVWVVHEYNLQLSRGSDETLFPFKRPGKEVLSNLTLIKKYASLLADEQFLRGTKFGNRESFLSELSSAIDSISSIIRCLRNSRNVDKTAIQSEIEQLVNRRVLETDVCEIVSAVQAEATARFLHVLPPGYEDARKIQNPYGDLIIWKEILEKCSEVQAESAVLLTNDLKRDWVVKPDFLILEGGYQVPNNGKQEREYFIPSPQLIHEFRLCTGRSDFHIVDIELLTSLLFSFEHNRLTYQEFEQLASAVQIDKEISPTQQVIQWFVDNQDAYNNALHGVCRWHYDPSEVDFDKLYEWAVERISDVDLNLVNWGDVFCELFL